MKNVIKVSIIISSYNREKWLKESIESSLQQTNIEPEVIVIDDGSTDKSIEVLKSFSSKIIYKIGTNKGVCFVRNKGLEIASGKYVVFLDCDDKFEIDSLYKQVALLEETGSDLCIGLWKKLKMFKSGRVEISIPSVQNLYREDDLLLRLLKYWWVPPLAYMHRRQFLQTNNIKWKVGFGFPDDFEFILRVALKDPKVCSLSEVTGYYRHHPGPRISVLRDEFESCQNLLYILDNAAAGIEQNGKKDDQALKSALCNYYLFVAKNMYDFDKTTALNILKKIYTIHPSFKPKNKFYSFCLHMMGFENLESVFGFRKKIYNFVRQERY